ncbi:MAG: AbrB/MazE/SpoVT family DNA-binding domain-containing protein [gamma proteobacterium symbiont of Taylorina sp.]|nr:AbrB/MazE/SpoVT family DNA-binding domain-containing protein [gamma proteobacterium symbiont of Taylorina sp.]
MKVTIKGQVTIPQEVREDLGIRPSETEVDFVCDEKGNWYLKKIKTKENSRFRRAHKCVKPMMSTDELMALTRG